MECQRSRPTLTPIRPRDHLAVNNGGKNKLGPEQVRLCSSARVTKDQGQQAPGVSRVRTSYHRPRQMQQVRTPVSDGRGSFVAALLAELDSAVQFVIDACW